MCVTQEYKSQYLYELDDNGDFNQTYHIFDSCCILQHMSHLLHVFGFESGQNILHKCHSTHMCIINIVVDAI